MWGMALKAICLVNSFRSRGSFTNTARVTGEKAGKAKIPKFKNRPYRDTGLRAIPAPAMR